MRYAPGCGRGVDRIAGHAFLLSGRTPIDGVWTIKRDIGKLLSSAGGRHATHTTSRFDVLVLGDLENSPVLEPENSLGQKAIYVFDRRQNGSHIHVVDGNGLSRLLRGELAPCLDLVRNEQGGKVFVRSTGF